MFAYASDLCIKLLFTYLLTYVDLEAELVVTEHGNVTQGP